MSYEYSLSYQRDSASGCQSLNGVEPEGGWDIDEVSMDISMDIDVPGSSKGSDTPSALPISSVEAAPPSYHKEKGHRVERLEEEEEDQGCSVLLGDLELWTSAKQLLHCRPSRPRSLPPVWSLEDLAGNARQNQKTNSRDPEP
jgi:hypothetical protein